jgi:hypothetical protein
MQKPRSIPAGARSAARKVLRWKDEHANEINGMTAVGWTRANQLANDSTVSVETAKRIKSFFARHGADPATFAVDPKYKKTPWKDAGYVSYLGWGGGAMHRASQGWNFDK